MIKENDRYGEDSRYSIQNQTDSTEYERMIIDLQNQIETLNDRLLENSFTNLELKQAIKKLEMLEQEKEGKIKQLNAKIELINKAQKDKRNRHLKEIYSLKKFTYQILQRYVSHQIYDENDENFYDYESNIENIIEEIIQSQKCQIVQIRKSFEPILQQQQIVIQNNDYHNLEQYFKDVVIQIKNKFQNTSDINQYSYNQSNMYEELKRLRLALNLFINDSVVMINNQLTQKRSFCKNIEDNKNYCTEIQTMLNSITKNLDQFEISLQQLSKVFKKIIQLVENPPSHKQLIHKIAKNTEYTIKKAMISANAIVEGGAKNPSLTNEVLIIQENQMKFLIMLTTLQFITLLVIGIFLFIELFTIYEEISILVLLVLLVIYVITLVVGQFEQDITQKFPKNIILFIINSLSRIFWIAYLVVLIDFIRFELIQLLIFINLLLMIIFFHLDRKSNIKNCFLIKNQLLRISIVVILEFGGVYSVLLFNDFETAILWFVIVITIYFWMLLDIQLIEFRKQLYKNDNIWYFAAIIFDGDNLFPCFFVNKHLLNEDFDSILI
ncbi:unnamed protein product [Paramecium pentaurelia]|uniref:Transmembrane protein n=1 Tax=Paramecium pentaurelia TaxID=43138 RepID=A0A8S1UJR9_9CILI|nr:unnamed protein product [Paramecium pentaurelia]